MPRKKVNRTTPSTASTITAPEEAGKTSVVRLSATCYELTDPVTGGRYVLRTKTPRTDTEVLAEIVSLIVKKGRVQKGRVCTMRSPA